MLITNLKMINSVRPNVAYCKNEFVQAVKLESPSCQEEIIYLKKDKP